MADLQKQLDDINVKILEVEQEILFIKSKHPEYYFELEGFIVLNKRIMQLEEIQKEYLKQLSTTMASASTNEVSSKQTATYDQLLEEIAKLKEENRGLKGDIYRKRGMFFHT